MTDGPFRRCRMRPRTRNAVWRTNGWTRTPRKGEAIVVTERDADSEIDGRDSKRKPVDTQQRLSPQRKRGACFELFVKVLTPFRHIAPLIDVSWFYINRARFSRLEKSHLEVPLR